jgi:hypothetical protein
MGVQKHYKKRFAKKSCRKVFTKILTKSPKTIFSRKPFITFLGVFTEYTGREQGCVGAALPATTAGPGEFGLEGTERVLVDQVQ